MNVKFFATIGIAIIGLLPVMATNPPVGTDKRVNALETRVASLETQVAGPGAKTVAATTGTPNATSVGTPSATSSKRKAIEFNGLDCKFVDANAVYASFSCKTEITNTTDAPIQLQVVFVAYDKDGFELDRSPDNVVVRENSTNTYTRKIIIQYPTAENVDHFRVDASVF